MSWTQLIKQDSWQQIGELIWQWLQSEIFISHSLVNLAAISIGFLLAWLIARPFKSRLASYLSSYDLRPTNLGRFLDALERSLTYVVATIVLWLAIALFHALSLKIYLLDLAESLLVAWVLICLISSVLRAPFWAKFIAITAWTIAALHILSLLNPLLVLLDRLAIPIGESRLSALVIIKFTIILFIMIRLASITTSVFKGRIKTLEGLTPSIQILLSKTVSITLTIIAVMVAAASLGIDLTGFAFIGGAVAVGIGFGLQKVVSNLVSGLVLLLDRSIKPSDVIAIDDTYGQIKNMGARYVSIVTRDGTEYLIPNEDLITSRVVNWSYTSTHLRIKIAVGVSYDSDLRLVKEVMIEAARKHSRVLSNPRPVCQLKNFGEYSIEMELRFWIHDPENGVANISSDVRMAIWEAFEENRIEIPFPQSVVYNLNQSTQKD